MEKIFKYTVPMESHPVIMLPKFADILTVQVQNGWPCIWAVIDENQPVQATHFIMYATGQEHNEMSGTYIGTFQLVDGTVWHLFLKAYSTL